MAIVKTDDTNYTNIANKIREYLATATKYKPSEMADGIEDVFEKGYINGYGYGYNQGCLDGEESAGNVTVKIENDILYAIKEAAE